MRKLLTRVFGLGALAAATYAVWRKLSRPSGSSGSPGLSWEAQPFPYPPHPRAEPTTPATESATKTATKTAAKAPAKPGAKPASEPWVEPPADGTCPTSHPVKAKLASGIFHVPGSANYDRTSPDRCYTSPEAAIADGLRAAKR